MKERNESVKYRGRDILVSMPTVSIHAPGMPQEDQSVLEQELKSLGGDYEILFELRESKSMEEQVFSFILLTIHNPKVQGVAATLATTLISRASAFAWKRYRTWAAHKRPTKVIIYGPDNRKIESKDIPYD